MSAQAISRRRCVVSAFTRLTDRNSSVNCAALLALKQLGLAGACGLNKTTPQAVVPASGSSLSSQSRCQIPDPTSCPAVVPRPFHTSTVRNLSRPQLATAQRLRLALCSRGRTQRAAPCRTTFGPTWSPCAPPTDGRCSCRPCCHAQRDGAHVHRRLLRRWRCRRLGAEPRVAAHAQALGRRAVSAGYPLAARLQRQPTGWPVSQWPCSSEVDLRGAVRGRGQRALRRSRSACACCASLAAPGTAPGDSLVRWQCSGGAHQARALDAALVHSHDSHGSASMARGRALRICARSWHRTLPAESSHLVVLPRAHSRPRVYLGLLELFLAAEADTLRAVGAGGPSVWGGP